MRISRCSGTGSDIGANVGSIRYDGHQYERCAAAIQQSIEKHFDNQIAVEICNVNSWYAFDVRIVPSGTDVDPGEGELIFCKTRSKRWPKIDEILQNIQEFCQTMVRVHCRESCGHMVATARRRVEIVAEHETSGATFRMVSNALNVAETRLFPGRYWIYCAPEGRHCGLTPDHVDVTSTFAPQDIHVIAAKKKTINFNVRDHFGKPLARVRVDVDELDGGTDGTCAHEELVTDLDGKCGCRLELGEHKATIVACTAVEPCEVFFEVEDREMPQVFSLNARRTRYLCEVMVQTELGEPIVGCPFEVEKLGSFEVYAKGEATDIGLVTAEFLPGPNKVQLCPLPGQPYLPLDFTVDVAEDGSFSPFLIKLSSKESEVTIRLITDTGDPARHCRFSLTKGEGGRPEFFDSESSGVAAVQMEFLTPYILEVFDNDSGDYASQRHLVRADRTEISLVIARPLLGKVSAELASLVIDLSGPIQRDGGAILHEMLVKALHKIGPGITLDVIVCGERQLAEKWAAAVSKQQKRLQCLGIVSTRIVVPGDAVRGVLSGLGDGFARASVEEVFLISDGRLDKEQLVDHVRWLHNAHPRQPRVHLVALIPADDKAAPAFHQFRGAAALTGGTFRLVRARKKRATSAREASLRKDRSGLWSASSNSSRSSSSSRQRQRTLSARLSPEI